MGIKPVAFHCSKRAKDNSVCLHLTKKKVCSISCKSSFKSGELSAIRNNLSFSHMDLMQSVFKWETQISQQSHQEHEHR